MDHPPGTIELAGGGFGVVGPEPLTERWGSGFGGLADSPAASRFASWPSVIDWFAFTTSSRSASDVLAAGASPGFALVVAIGVLASAPWPGPAHAASSVAMANSRFIDAAYFSSFPALGSPR